MTVNNFLTVISQPAMLIGWTYPLWASVLTLALLIVFGLATYHYLRTRRRDTTGTGSSE